jgi:hypothetical protein
VVASEKGRAASLGFWFAVAALFAAYLVVGFWFVAAGQLNLDEGWYLYASRLVYDGWLPYRDFAFFQTPLLPLVYGLPQKVFGAGLEVGRFTSLLLGVITIALGSRLSFVRGGRCGTLVFLALVPVTPLLVWTFATTRSEPLNACLLMLSAFWLFAGDSSPRRTGAAAVAVVLAAATRVASFPAALLVLGWAAYRYRGSRRDLVIALAPALLVGAVIAAVMLMAGLDAVVFNLVTSQAERHGRLQVGDSWTVWKYISRRIADISMLGSYYGGLGIVLLIGAVGVVAAWLSTRERGSFSQWASALTALRRFRLDRVFQEFGQFSDSLYVLVPVRR